MTSVTLRERLRTTGIVGSFVSLDSPVSIEVMARSGFDFLCIDAEHAPFSTSDIQSLVIAADSAGVPVIVRVPEGNIEVSRVLDTGATGILVPRVESATDAARAVAFARFAPDGARGAGPGRASFYGGNSAEYIVTANERTIVAVQVETAAGLENVAEIAGVPGVDVVFVGPLDLSVSLGVSVGSAQHNQAVDRIFAAARTAGAATGIFCIDTEGYLAIADRHPDFVIVATDSMFLAQAASATATAVLAERASR